MHIALYAPYLFPGTRPGVATQTVSVGYESLTPEKGASQLALQYRLIDRYLQKATNLLRAEKCMGSNQCRSLRLGPTST
jgi:hypothetical protein